MESASEMIKKLSSLHSKLHIAKLHQLEIFFLFAAKIAKKAKNEALEHVSTELSGVFDIDVVFFNNILGTKDISNHGVHPTVGHGIPKFLRNVRNFYVNQGLKCPKLK